LYPAEDNSNFGRVTSLTTEPSCGRWADDHRVVVSVSSEPLSIVSPTLVATMTNASGVAAIAIQANATPGTYTIVAQGIGVADVLFNLKNLIKMYLPLILKY
jgi:hypothetical protein